MEQHPIPQQITSYEFKLVGEMTLKQFGKAAGGIVIALLINASKLVFFVKWPLMFLFGGLGLALAFLPYQDRPLETWMMAFIRSIYSPTIYIWKKKVNRNWLEIDLSKKLEPAEQKIEVPVKEESKVKEFIQSLPSVKVETKEEPVKPKPETKTEQTVKTETKQKTEEDSRSVAEKVYENWRTEEANLNLKKEKMMATGTAVFGEIPMPDTPEIPNVLVGMVTDNNGKIVTDAIIEIEDENGNPSRVLRTNALGQFKSSTQLADGKYLVATEKEGHKFEVVQVAMNGKIVEPIKIQAVG